MPNKAFDNLNEIDKELRQMFPTGMNTGVQVIIEKIVGFELFNTRPYHNYEAWSDGYRIKTPDGKFKVEAEDLDTAVKLLKLKMEGTVK